MAGEKTEKATPKRRQDERKKGNVFQGKDITIAFSILVMFVALRLLGPYIYEYLLKTFSYFFTSAGNIKSISVEDLTQLTINIAGRVLLMVLPLLLISALVAFILSGVQTKFIFNFSTLKFKMNRLNPINGMKNKFSVKQILQLLKSILMVIVLVFFLYSDISEFSKNIVSFYSIPVAQTVAVIATTVFNVFIKVSIVVIFVGIVDYFIQWWQYEKDLKMSKQEVKDELKQMEGDPQVKSEIRSRQRRMATGRMMQDVPEADVVIVNPEHFAVALKYDAELYSAPVVLAKGKNNVALKIKEIAKEHNIEIKENPPLARALYKATEVGKEIPPDFYQAVAEILSYIYNLRRYY